MAVAGFMVQFFCGSCELDLPVQLDHTSRTSPMLCQRCGWYGWPGMVVVKISTLEQHLHLRNPVDYKPSLDGLPAT